MEKGLKQRASRMILSMQTCRPGTAFASRGPPNTAVATTPCGPSAADFKTPGTLSLDGMPNNTLPYIPPLHGWSTRANAFFLRKQACQVYTPLPVLKKVHND